MKLVIKVLTSLETLLVHTATLKLHPALFHYQELMFLLVLYVGGCLNPKLDF